MSVLILAARRAWSWHRPLTIFVGLMAVLAAAAALGVLMDDRVLGGAPVWLKPFKFAVSFVIYGATIAWIISRLPDRRRWAWILGAIIVVTSVIEMVIIVGQAARGTHSHFNVSTALNAVLWSTMAAPSSFSGWLPWGSRPSPPGASSATDRSPWRSGSGCWSR